MFYSYIILDWEMPILDGLDTTKEIKKICKEEGINIIVVILTGYD